MPDYTKRFGKVMSFEDEVGNSYPNSFWALSKTEIDGEESMATLTFRGWRSPQDYDAGRRYFEQKQYVITGAAFLALTERSTNLPSAMPEIARDLVLAWTVALETKDVFVSMGEDSQPVWRSFFEGATDAQ